MSTPHELVTRYLAAIEQLTPAGRASFSPGGGTLAVDAPDAACAVALYAAHDGQADDMPPEIVDGYYWMRIADIAEVREDLDGMAKVGEWDDDNYKRVNWWVPGWIPLLTDGNSNYICIDTTGTFTGKVGQVIEHIHDMVDRDVLAPSFDAWFAALVESMEGGGWKLDEEGERLEKTAKGKKLIAERLTGYPLAHKAQKVKKEKPKAPPKPKASRAPKAKPEEVVLLKLYKERMNASEIKGAIAAGARLDVEDPVEGTPLHIAMQCGNELPAQALIEAGANVNAARARDGYTPAHCAAYAHARVAPALIQVLAAAGANLSALDASGRTPASYAITQEARDAFAAHGAA